MREEQDSGIGYALVVFTIRAIFVVGWLKLPIASLFARGGTSRTAPLLQSNTVNNFSSVLGQQIIYEENRLGDFLRYSLKGYDNMNNKTKMYVSVGVFSAIAFILQVIGSFMGLKVAGFLEIEISDLPALIMAFAFGPWAGVFTEFIKNLLHTTMTSTGFVGELANFVINGTLCLVAGLLYKKNKTRKGAVIALISATFLMAIAGVLANLFIMLPLYMPTAPFEAKLNLVLYTIFPFNIVRGLSLSLITFLIYKKISPIIKGK